MTSIVLGHPYAGSLYAYISDQIGGDQSHTPAVSSHPYYRTLYGSNYAKNVEISLNFLLLFDDVWIVPADNHWPSSTSEFVPERGLHRDWNAFHALPQKERDDLIDHFLGDNVLQSLLTDRFQIRPGAHRQILSEALYDAYISAYKRIPLLCSPGRRQIIDRLMALEQPSLRPRFGPGETIDFIESYRALKGLSLKPKNLDDLMDAKPNRDVRRYASRFLELALAESAAGRHPEPKRVATLILEAIETERLAKLCAGTLEWAATSMHLVVVHNPLVAISAAVAAKSGASFFERLAESSRWYEFSGKIDEAIGTAGILRNLKILERQSLDEDRGNS